jgi:hypothetical protein
MRQKDRKSMPSASRIKGKCARLVGRQSSSIVSQHHVKSNKEPNNENPYRGQPFTAPRSNRQEHVFEHKKKRGLPKEAKSPSKHHHLHPHVNALRSSFHGTRAVVISKFERSLGDEFLHGFAADFVISASS